MQNVAYFASDGSYGDADGIVLIDTTEWTSDEWEEVNNMDDDERYEFACMLAKAAQSR